MAADKADERTHDEKGTNESDDEPDRDQFRTLEGQNGAVFVEVVNRRADRVVHPRRSAASRVAAPRNPDNSDGLAVGKAGRHEYLNEQRKRAICPQRGSGGSGASVAKRKIVVEWKSCPGFSSVVGKFGLLGLSGKCCVSSVNASVWR